MESRPQASKEDLRKQLQDLQEDWNSYKNSAPRRRSHSASGLPASSPDLLHLVRTSPKQLLSSLQKPRSPEAEASTAERLKAARRDWVPGRRLFEALESAEEVVDFHGKEEEMCSVCTSILIQGSGMRSVSCSCCSSSLSSSLAVEDGGRKMAVGGGGKRMVVVRWRCFVIVVCVVVAASFLMSTREVFGVGEDGDYVFPT